MAYFLKNQNDEQNQQSGNQNQMSGGNIYSTSGSEVSSSTPTSTSSNSSSNSSQSNESGNWVNLNKYLDANKKSTSDYVNNLVSPYSQKEGDYRTNLQTANDKYISDIQNDTAYKTGADASRKIANTYYQNSKDVSDDDLGTFYTTLGGYKGAGNFSDTGDTYGYTGLKKQSDEFNTVSGNLANENYLKSLMGNNVSSGGKALNSLLVKGSAEGKQAIEDNSTKFSNLAKLLDDQSAALNDRRANVIDTATQNQLAAQNAIEDEYNKTQDALIAANKKAQADAQKTKEKTEKYTAPLNLGADSKFGGRLSTSVNINPLAYVSSVEGDAQLLNEQNELNQRKQDLLAGQRTADSSLDTDFNYGSVQEAARLKQKTASMNKVLSEVINNNPVIEDLQGFGLINPIQAAQATNLVNEVIQNDPEVKQAFVDFYNNKINESTLKGHLLSKLDNFLRASWGIW